MKKSAFRILMNTGLVFLFSSFLFTACTKEESLSTPSTSPAKELAGEYAVSDLTHNGQRALQSVIEGSIKSGCKSEIPFTNKFDIKKFVWSFSRAGNVKYSLTSVMDVVDHNASVNSCKAVYNSKVVNKSRNGSWEFSEESKTFNIRFGKSKNAETYKFQRLTDDSFQLEGKVGGNVVVITLTRI